MEIINEISYDKEDESVFIKIVQGYVFFSSYKSSFIGERINRLEGYSGPGDYYTKKHPAFDIKLYAQNLLTGATITLDEDLNRRKLNYQVIEVRDEIYVFKKTNQVKIYKLQN